MSSSMRSLQVPRPDLTRRDMFRLTAVGAAGLSLVAACSDDDDTSSSADGEAGELVRGGTLIVGRTSTIEQLDPTIQPLLGFPGAAYTMAVFEVLLPVEVDGEQTNSLSTGFEISSDGLEITCELREGVQWHSGRDFVAQDVVWNFERLKDPAFQETPRGNVPARAESIAEVRVLDDHTVRFVLSQPDQTPLTLMQSILKIVDPESEAEMVASEGVSGTGPYMLEEFNPGQSMLLVRNPNYWGEGAYLDEIELRTVADAQTLAVQLESGEIHVAEPLPPAEIVRLQEAGFGAVVTPSPNAFLTFVANLDVPPLDDRRVRQALMYAIDRERINDEAQAGLGVPKAVVWPSGSAAFHEEQANAYPFDLDRAQELLDEAGVTGVELDVSVDNRVPAYAQMSEILRNDLAQIGITLNVMVEDPAVHTERWQTGDYELLGRGIGASWLDGTVVLSPPFLRPIPGENVTGFANERYTELAQAASVLGMDEDERQELLAEMTDIMLEEAFVLPVADRPLATATAPEVHGVAYPPFAVAPELWLREAWIEA